MEISENIISIYVALSLQGQKCGFVQKFTVFQGFFAIRQRKALLLNPEGLRAKPTGLSSEDRTADCVPVQFTRKKFNCFKRKY